MNSLITYDVQEAVISEMQKYTDLTINGMEDKEGYKKVHDARMIVKNTRVKVEKRQKEIRKALKSQIEKDIEMCDKEAARLLSLLNPIEEDLNVKEQAINVQIDEIKNRAKRAAEALEKFNRDWDEAIIIDTGIEQEKERIRLQKIKDEQDLRDKELKDKQDQIDKDAREIEHKKELEKVRIDTLRETRFAALKSIGFTYPFDDLGEMSEIAYLSMYDEHFKVWNEKVRADKPDTISEVPVEVVVDKQPDSNFTWDDDNGGVKHVPCEQKMSDNQAEIERQRVEAARPDMDKLDQIAESIFNAANKIRDIEIESDNAMRIKYIVESKLLDLSQWIRDQIEVDVPEPVKSNDSEVDWS